MDFTDLNSGGSVIDFDGFNNSTFNNFSTESESFQSISNQIALQSPFGRDSHFYVPEYEEDNIDFVKLIAFINRGKDAEFDFENFIGTSVRRVTKIISFGEEAKFDRMAGIPTSYISEETVEVEVPVTDRYASRYLALEGRLNKETGTVNLKKNTDTDKTAGFEFEFDLSSTKVSYKLHFYYVGAKRVYEKDNKGQIAFTISTPVYEDFLELFALCSYHYKDSSFEDNIKTTFLDALTKIELSPDSIGEFNETKINRDKFEELNWLYQYIPRFVANTLDFTRALRNVFKLSWYDGSKRFNNDFDTTAGITGILTKLQSDKVYEHFYKNPDELIELYELFDGEDLIRSFCDYLTAISFKYVAKDFQPRTFDVSEDGDKHIETNILFGDEDGKVQITNELQIPLLGFDSGALAMYLFADDLEINNPGGQSNQFHPLDIIYIKRLDSDLNEVEIIPTIALYAKYLGDTSEWSDVTDAALAAVDIIGIITSGGALSAGARGVARLFAIVDIAISTVNLALVVPGVKSELNKTEAGKWFVSHWGIISLCVNAGTISYYLAKGIIKYGAKFKQQLKDKKIAKQIDELLEESEKVVLNSGRIVDEFKLITTTDELVSFLERIDESVKATELEQVGIDVLFRGTTKNADGKLFKGNLNSIEYGTSTSTDPIRAVIFGIESATESRTKGFLQIYETKRLTGLNLQAPNRRVNIELEVIVKTSPESLSNFAVTEIPIEDARKIIEKVYGITLPSRISGRDISRDLLSETRKITPSEVQNFYKEINN